MQKLENYWTEQTVEEVTGFKLQTLRNWRHLSVGPAYLKVGRSVRYRPQDIAAYMEKTRIDPEG